jgi:hypothetical protein
MLITSTKNSSNSATEITTDTPAAAAAGKDLYLFVVADSTTGTIDTPAATTSTILAVVGGNAQVACFKIALAAAPAASYTITTSGGKPAANLALIIVCVDGEGGDFVSDTLVARTTGTGTTATTNTATNAGDVSALLAAFDSDDPASITTAPDGMTQQQYADMDSSELVVYSEIDFGTGTQALVWSTSVDWSCYGIVARWTAAPGGLALPIAAHNYAQNG